MSGNIMSNDVGENLFVNRCALPECQNYITKIQVDDCFDWVCEACCCFEHCIELTERMKHHHCLCCGCSTENKPYKSFCGNNECMKNITSKQSMLSWFVEPFDESCYKTF